MSLITGKTAKNSPTVPDRVPGTQRTKYRTSHSTLYLRSHVEFVSGSELYTSSIVPTIVRSTSEVSYIARMSSCDTVQNDWKRKRTR